MHHRGVLFHLCATCGVEQDPNTPLPDECAICADERQYIPLGGQEWTTVEALAGAGYRAVEHEVEPGLHGLYVDPKTAIGQQSLVIRGRSKMARTVASHSQRHACTAVKIATCSRSQ